MVVYSQVEIGGKPFTSAASDSGMKIRSEEGRIYDDAVYPPTDGHSFTETDIPIEGGEIVKYSTLSIKRELAKLGKWDEAKALIERSGAWDDYILANYLAENDPVFVAAKAAFVAAGILTADELAELLPKCVWTAE